MRRGRIITVAIAACAVFLLTVSSAFAATPRQIYADLADNGKLDTAYTRADLQNAALDASVQGYGGTVVGTLKPVANVAGAVATVCGSSSASGGTNGTSAGMNGAKCGKSYTCAGVKGTSRTSGTGSTGAPGSHKCGVAGVQHTAAGTLPFTGQQLSLFLVLGLMLVASGLLLRRTAREKSRS